MRLITDLGVLTAMCGLVGLVMLGFWLAIKVRIRFFPDYHDIYGR